MIAADGRFSSHQAFVANADQMLIAGTGRSDVD